MVKSKTGKGGDDKMTVRELIEHLEKFNEDALVEVFVGEKVFEAEVDSDAPFSKEFRGEVCLFTGKEIG